MPLLSTFHPPNPPHVLTYFIPEGPTDTDDMNDTTKAMIPKSRTHYETVGTISVDS